MTKDNVKMIKKLGVTNPEKYFPKKVESSSKESNRKHIDKKDK